jgi:hypothetical protein
MASIVVSGDTSGAITIAAPAEAGTNTLTLPTNTGTIITTASSGQSIPKAALPTGSVLQVIQTNTTADSSTTSNSYVDTNLSVTITPTSSSSKILISTCGSIRKNSGNGDTGAYVNIVRGATQIAEQGFLAWTGASGFNQESLNLIYLDSPSTTSSTTYKIQIRTTVSGQGVQISHDSSMNSITVMEIAA